MELTSSSTGNATSSFPIGIHITEQESCFVLWALACLSAEMESDWPRRAGGVLPVKERIVN